MAFPSTLVVLIISLLSIGLFTVSSAQDPTALLNNVTLAGVVTCPNTSLADAKTYRAIPQARVDVVCGVLFLQRVTKSTTADPLGVYSFSFSTLEILLNPPELCFLKVTLPTNSCNFNSSAGGFLRFPIIGIRKSSALVSPVVEYIPGAPSYLRS